MVRAGLAYFTCPSRYRRSGPRHCGGAVPQKAPTSWRPIPVADRPFDVSSKVTTAGMSLAFDRSEAWLALKTLYLTKKPSLRPNFLLVEAAAPVHQDYATHVDKAPFHRGPYGPSTIGFSVSSFANPKWKAIARNTGYQQTSSTDVSGIDSGCPVIRGIMASAQACRAVRQPCSKT